MEAITASLGAIIAVVKSGWSLVTRKRNKLRITVERDGMDNSENILASRTTVLIANAGNQYERNVKVEIDAAVNPEDGLRFHQVGCETSDAVRIQRVEDRPKPSSQFQHGILKLDINGLDKGDAVFVKILSSDFIETIRVYAVSDTTKPVIYDTLRR